MLTKMKSQGSYISYILWGNISDKNQVSIYWLRNIDIKSISSSESEYIAGDIMRYEYNYFIQFGLWQDFINMIITEIWSIV